MSVDLTDVLVGPHQYVTIFNIVTIIPTTTVLFCVYIYYHYLYTMTTKKVPQRRNKNAGKSTGTSKSAKYFASHPKARANKNKKNTKREATPASKAKRAVLNKKSRANTCPKGQDNAHTGNGNKTKCQKRSINRGANGRGKRSRIS